MFCRRCLPYAISGGGKKQHSAQVERMRDRDTQVEELSKDHWRSQLNSKMQLSAGAGGLPSFQEWLQKKKTEEAERSWIPKESKASMLRKSLHRADKEQSLSIRSSAAWPEAVETLSQLERRIRAKVEQQALERNIGDVGAEPLLMEIQAFDGLFDDALQAAACISPAMVSRFKVISSHPMPSASAILRQPRQACRGRVPKSDLRCSMSLISIKGQDAAPPLGQFCVLDDRQPARTNAATRSHAE
jgi:hypothetical protein